MLKMSLSGAQKGPGLPQLIFGVVPNKHYGLIWLLLGMA